MGRKEERAVTRELDRLLLREPRFVHLSKKVRVAQRKLKEAILHFREAVALDPRYAQAYYNLGRALAETGAAGEAAAQWRKALEIDPQLAEAAAALRGQGR